MIGLYRREVKATIVQYTRLGKVTIHFKGGKGKDQALIKTNGQSIAVRNSKGKLIYGTPMPSTVTVDSIKHLSIVDGDEVLFERGKGYQGKNGKKDDKKDGKKDRKKDKQSKNGKKGNNQKRF